MAARVTKTIEVSLRPCALDPFDIRHSTDSGVCRRRSTAAAALPGGHSLEAPGLARRLHGYDAQTKYGLVIYTVQLVLDKTYTTV